MGTLLKEQRGRPTLWDVGGEAIRSSITGQESSPSREVNLCARGRIKAVPRGWKNRVRRTPRSNQPILSKPGASAAARGKNTKSHRKERSSRERMQDRVLLPPKATRKKKKKRNRLSLTEQEKKDKVKLA